MKQRVTDALDCCAIGSRCTLWSRRRGTGLSAAEGHHSSSGLTLAPGGATLVRDQGELAEDIIVQTTTPF